MPCEQPPYILHSVPLVLPAQVARRSLYSRVGTQGARGLRAHTHTHRHARAVLPSIHTRSRAWADGRMGGRTAAAAQWLGSALTSLGSACRPEALHVRRPPPLGGAGGSRSWANTESSPEELELGVSWPPGEYCSKGTDRSRYSCRWAARRPSSSQSSALPMPLCPHPAEPSLTSVEVTVRMRSRSSTSCLKVGLCEGTACQHSLMIMYLGGRSGPAPAWGLLPASLRNGLERPLSHPGAEATETRALSPWEPPCGQVRAGRWTVSVLTGRACSWPACPCGGPPSAA